MFRGVRVRALPTSASGYAPYTSRRVRGTAGKQGRKKPQDALAVARQALRTAKAVAAERELKVLENTLVNMDMGNDVTGQWPNAVGAVIGNGGCVFPLCFMGQGLTEITRIGEQIQAKGVELRGHVGFINMEKPNLAVRFIIFRDKQQRNSGTVPGAFEVLQVTRTNSLLQWDNIDRWEILVDDTKYYNAPESSITHDGCPRFPFHYKRKLNFPIHYSGSASNTCDKNGLFLLMIADYCEAFPAIDTTTTLPGASNYALMDCTARFTYTDA